MKIINKIKKQDFFYKLINNGVLLISGLNENLESYRIIKYDNKTYKIKIEN